MKPQTFTLDSPQNRNHAHRLIDLAVLENKPWMITIGPEEQAEEADRQMAIELIRAKATINALKADIADLKQRLLNKELAGDYGLREQKQ
jgi:hypothetical protein